MRKKSLPAGWRLWFWWTLASTVGFLAGGAGGTTVSNALFSGEEGVVALSVAFVFSGILLGTAQWLILRKYISRSSPWILGNAVGFAMFGAVYETDSVTFIMVFIAVGALVGFAQWLILRKHLIKAGWWMVASTLGFSLYGLVPTVAEVVNQAAGIGWASVIVLVIVAMYGGITGGALVWLLGQSAAAEVEPTQDAQ